MIYDRRDDVSQADLGGELYGQIREYVSSVCQDDGTQDTLIAGATVPHPETPGYILTMRGNGGLWQCMYGSALMKGGDVYAREQAFDIHISRCAGRGAYVGRRLGS